MALLSYEFMRRVFLVAIFIAGVASMLSVFLVIRRQPLMANTLSHVSLAGVALGFLLNLSPTLTTVLIVILAAVILECLRMIYRTYSEISIAILMAGGLALALVLMNLNGGDSVTSIQSYLFGSIMAIIWEQVISLGILFVAIGILFFLFKQPMYVLTFDGDTTHVSGLSVHLMSMTFNVITGVAVAVMIPIAGVLLISTIMALPTTIGMRSGKSFNTVIAISVCVGFLGMLSGLTSSFYLDTPPGAATTLVSIASVLIVSIIRRMLVALRRKNNQVIEKRNLIKTKDFL